MPQRPYLSVLNQICKERKEMEIFWQIYCFVVVIDFPKVVSLCSNAICTGVVFVSGPVGDTVYLQTTENTSYWKYNADAYTKGRIRLPILFFSLDLLLLVYP